MEYPVDEGKGKTGYKTEHPLGTSVPCTMKLRLNGFNNLLPHSENSPIMNAVLHEIRRNVR